MNRYVHNLRLEGIGREGQEKLLTSRLLIVGAGALGASAAMYAAGSGVGNIYAIDFDTVDLSNLQRQVFYAELDAGRKKVEVLEERIRGLNSNCRFVGIDAFFSPRNASDLIGDADFVIDAADNPDTTYLIEDVCETAGKPYVTAGVADFHAQILTHIPGSLNFSDLFPKVQGEGSVLPCSIGGVFGPLTGVVACLQAAEAIKYLTGCGDILVDSLQTIDLRTLSFNTLRIK